MSSIDLFLGLAGASFDPVTIKAVSTAYDKARQVLYDCRQPPLVQQVIADRIIACVANGERDTDKLVTAALRGFID